MARCHTEELRALIGLDYTHCVGLIVHQFCNLLLWQVLYARLTAFVNVAFHGCNLVTVEQPKTTALLIECKPMHSNHVFIRIYIPFISHSSRSVCQWYHCRSAHCAFQFEVITRGLVNHRHSIGKRQQDF